MTRSAAILYLDARRGARRGGRAHAAGGAPPAGSFYIDLRRHADEAPEPPTLRLVPAEPRPGRAGAARAAAELLAPDPDAVRARFAALVARWKDETRFESSSTKLFLHPAYQQLIGLGPAALPLLLEALAGSPEHFGWALRAITGQDPVPPEARGNLPAMAAAWLEWARRAGLL